MAQSVRARAANDPEPVPAGEYRARIVDAVIERVSRTGDFGRCLKLTWQIEAGPFANRQIRQRLSLWAENMRNLDKVTAIANAQFAAIRTATGRLMPQDIDELCDIACRIKVGISSDPSRRHGRRNEVRAVRAIGAAPVPPAERPAPTGDREARSPAVAQDMNDDMPF